MERDEIPTNIYSESKMGLDYKSRFCTLKCEISESEEKGLTTEKILVLFAISLL